VGKKKNRDRRASEGGTDIWSYAFPNKDQNNYAEVASVSVMFLMKHPISRCSST
jgi:hypothetical protein